MNLNVTENKERHRFEATVGSGLALIEYIRAKNGVYLTHTEVPEKEEGEGVGTELVKQTLEMLQEEGVKIVPQCPFVAHYIRENPEWKSMIADGYHV
ncbi:GNAT family N-acetyltransferase [Luteirhabdus pelagi]|uniref:GNAT family N-acetyltransferase n=1 Tax=Luteirhabdus pelagi TaxID=2792783 RepID=UPI00193A0B79|nr:GNAT family N-acetyltransferase [Luteirhabdus pelagi]